MNPVGSKKLPPGHLINKVHGSTFYLPLPLQETLKRLPSQTQPIVDHGEPFVLLRSIPTTKKWLGKILLISQKYYGALKKLKDINPIYSEINLPALPSNLELGSKISEHVVESDPNEDKNTDDEIGDGNAMVRKVAKDEEAELYKNYTIQTLHPPRVNEKATDLYQLLKINEPPLDAQCKQLEEMCFPSIFTHGVYGMQFSREVPLGPSEYVNAILQSRDSRFCMNQQFIFFHFHQATIRQLSSGTYHKLKILRPKDKLTVGRYLDMVSNDEIEADLTSIFSRLRNSEQYWIKPCNDLNCMTMYCGPATWFLTLSPSEWTWDEMGDYLRKINPSLKEISISALVANDPVSVCRYMENTHKTFIDFILSPDNPIGKVNHYFCRREYQGRGLQHFHFALWIENAPITGENSNKEVTQFIAKYVTCRIPDKMCHQYCMTEL